MAQIDKLFAKLSINQRMIINLLVTMAGLLAMLALVFSQSTQLREVSTKASLSESLNSGMLMLRRNEKDFLARIDLKYAQKHDQNYKLLVQRIEQYQKLDNDNEHAEVFRQNIEQYHQHFQALVALQEQIGLSPKEGLYGALREAVHNIEEIVKAQDNYPLLAQTLMLRRREKDFMLRLDIKYIEKFNADIAKFSTMLRQQDLPASSNKKITELLNIYQDKFIAFADGIKAKGLSAKEGRLGELREDVHVSEVTLKELTAINQSHIDETIANSRTTAMFSAIAITFIVCAFIFLSSRSILQPILAVTRWIAKVRTDDDLTLRQEIDGEDEIATMVGHLNSLVDDFQQLVSNVETTLKTLDKAAKGLTDTAETTQHEMGHQLNETDMVATAVTQMRATIDEIAQNTEQAAFKSNEANDNAQAGHREVTQTSDSIGELSGQLSQAGGVVQQLEQDTQNIGSVLDVIRNIAEQTNLLALNAAIEAARAGEQGRGFAVVADEVRNLAMRTQESTTEIEQIIKTLQSRTQSVVELMDQCRAKGNDCSAQANNTGTLLQQITGDITMVSDMSVQIATAIEEQSQVASEVNQNVVHIRDIADQSNQNALSIVSVSESVEKQSNILVDAIKRFKI